MPHTPAVIRRLLLIVPAIAAVAAGGPHAHAAPRALDVVGDDTPAWSPDGSRIAFTSFRYGRGDIWTMRPDGSGHQQLTTNTAHDDMAAWSPDGTKIAFASDRTGDAQVWSMNADGSDQQQLTFDGSNFSPTWSPDGRRVAFRSDRDGNTEIYSMRADGSDQRRLTDSTRSDNSPTWGPDGRILWVSNRTTGGKTSIWVMNGDGTDQHRLTPESFFWNEAAPAWSPDGRSIVFRADRDVPLGNTELYRMTSDATQLRRLTTYPGRDDAPSWSPDGLHIAFSRGPSEFQNEVYAMNADGTGVRELTLPVLRGLNFETFPRRPAAGRGFRAVYDVSELSGGTTIPARVVCRARVGRHALRPASERFVATTGRATCTWRVPRSARGKLLLGAIAVRASTGTTSQTFALRVR